MWIRGVALGLMLAVASAPARAGDPAPPPASAAAAADAAVVAFQAKNATALRAIASAEAPDPFVVAETLFMRHVQGALASPPRPGDHLAAAAALAEAGSGAPTAQGLAAVVATWAHLDAAGLSREQRLQAAVNEAETSFDEKRYGDIVVAVDGLRGEIEAAQGSLAGTLLLHLKAESLFRLHRLEEAARAYRASAAASGPRTWRCLQAKAFLGAAKADYARGEFRGALAAREQELEVRRALGNPLGVARTLGAMGLVYSALGDQSKALELHHRSVEGKREGGDLLGAARSLVNVGLAQYRLGRYPDALATYAEAQKALEGMGDASGVLVILVNVSAIRSDLGQFGDALVAAERARREALRLGEASTALAALSNVGNARYALGDNAAALDDLEQVEKEARQLGERPRLADVLNNLGLLHDRLGRTPEALAHFEQALELRRSMRDRVGEAMVLGNMALVYAREGQPLRAVAANEGALAEKEALGDEAGAIATLVNLGNEYASAGKPTEALRALTRARDRAKAFGRRTLVVMAELSLARAYGEAGESAEAIEGIERLLPDLEKFEMRVELAKAHGNLAYHRLALGDAVGAVADARSALELRMRETRGLGESQSMEARDKSRNAADVGLLAAGRLAERAAGSGEAAAAGFWFAEAGRGLSLAEVVVNRKALLGAVLRPDLLDAQRAARDHIVATRDALAAAQSRPAADERAVEAARSALKAAYLELDAAIARVQREARRTADVAYPTPLALADLQKLLPVGTALIEYQLTSGQAVAVVATRSRATIRDLGLAADITVHAEELLRAFAHDGEAEVDAAAALYAQILEPLEPELEGVTRLLVSGDGVLTFVPFDALVRRKGVTKERAIERWEIAYVPSGTVYAALLEDAKAGGGGRALVAFGDPLYPAPGSSPPTALAAAPPGTDPTRDASLRGLASLEALPGTRAEVLGIADLFSPTERTAAFGADASVAGLSAALAARHGRLRAFHLACHGHVDAERPWLSGLVLSNREILSLDQIYRMSIPSDLVVLSACRTARGKTMRGEGVMGLVRGFFHAGSPRVVVSDWSVSDDSTRELMVSFYTRMLKGGLAPSAALRAAKIEMLKAGGMRAHPYHWAAFVLWGLAD